MRQKLSTHRITSIILRTTLRFAALHVREKQVDYERESKNGYHKPAQGTDKRGDIFDWGEREKGDLDTTMRQTEEESICPRSVLVRFLPIMREAEGNTMITESLAVSLRLKGVYSSRRVARELEEPVGSLFLVAQKYTLSCSTPEQSREPIRSG